MAATFVGARRVTAAPCGRPAINGPAGPATAPGEPHLVAMSPRSYVRSWCDRRPRSLRTGRAGRCAVSDREKAIAEQGVVTERIVEKHVKNIFATLGLPPSADKYRPVMAVLTFLNSQ
jgi:hypothetical protein